MPSDSYNLQGTVEEILPERQGGQKTFQTVVVRTPGQYSQLIPVEFGEKCLSRVRDLRRGDDIDLDFSLRGREYGGKFYVNLSGFRINGQSGADKFNRPPERQERRPSEPVRRQDAAGHRESRRSEPDEYDF